MKNIISIALLSAMLMSGCASTQQSNSSSQDEEAKVSTPVSQPVAVPAASAKKVVLNMSGEKSSMEASDWASFKEEWRATFADHAKEAGIAFEMQEGAPHPIGEPGTLLVVHVNDYHMVGIGARIFLGVMTGNAYIDAKVRFADLNNGNPFGEQEFNTTSSAWEGVFGKMTPQQVDTIAADVFFQLKNAH